MGNNKVIQRPTGQGPAVVAPIDILPAPLRELRDEGKAKVQALFSTLFDGADDALFELADKSSSNAVQTMYFDSMREVRIKRKAIESIFLDNFQNSFRTLYQADGDSVEAAENLDSSAPLSLVGDDDMEEQVAIQGMVARVKNRSGEALATLSLCIDQLVHIKTIKDTTNPFGPMQLCACFQEAAHELELDIRAKLVIYKLFEKFVLDEIGEVYSWANDTLASMGVVPPQESARSQAGQQKSQSGSGAVAPSSGPVEELSDEDNEIFDFLQNLLAGRRAEASVPQGTGLGGSTPVKSVSSNELLGMLSSLQNQLPNQPQQAQVIHKPVNVQEAISGLVADGGQAHAATFQQGDEDIINLVSMLFEFILDDRNLPPTMKALLGRLQIPLLKVAVLDRRFFSRNGHPARKLLNEMAMSALGWTEHSNLDNDPLYQKIDSIVDRILHEFADNVELFDYLLEEFTEFLAKEKRRAELIEQRTREAEEGAGKAQKSRAVVAYVLNDKAAGKRLPRVVVELLRDGWSHFMLLTHLKEGVESEQWAEAVQVVDDLLWSVQVEPGSADTKQLLKQLPGLLNRLRKGLNNTAVSKVTLREWFSKLQQVHMACLRTPEEGGETAEQNNAPIMSAPTADEDAPDVAELAEASENSDEQLNEEVAEEVVAEESPVIIETEELEEEEAEDSDREYAQIADSLRVGSWVELGEENKDRQRAKLAAIVRATGKYIFVNRIGMKVAERLRADLIEDLKSGQVVVLDSALLFDRALESVISGLRED